MINQKISASIANLPILSIITHQEYFSRYEQNPSLLETAFSTALAEEKTKNGRSEADHLEKLISYCKIIFGAFDSGDFFLTAPTDDNFCAQLIYLEIAKQTGFYEAINSTTDLSETEQLKKFTGAFIGMSMAFILAIQHPTFRLYGQLSTEQQAEQMADMLCSYIDNVSKRQNKVFRDHSSVLGSIVESSRENSPETKETKLKEIDSPTIKSSPTAQTTLASSPFMNTDFLGQTQDIEQEDKKKSTQELVVWKHPTAIKLFESLLSLVPVQAFLPEPSSASSHSSLRSSEFRRFSSDTRIADRQKGY